MEALILFLILASPLLLGALLFSLLRNWWLGFILVLFLMLVPLFLTPFLVSQHIEVEPTGFVADIPKLSLVVIFTSLLICTLGYVKRPWLRMLLLPVLYILGLCLSIFVGVNLGIIAK